MTASARTAQKVRILLAPMMSASAMLAASSGASASTGAPAPIKVNLPQGFEDLAATQKAMVDLYFGDRLMGQVEVAYEPGRLRFTNVEAVIALLPDLLDPAAIRAALSHAALDTHPELVCSSGADRQICGRLNPAVAGLIFDQDRFQLSLFINPRLLKVRPATQSAFLSRPNAPFGLVDSLAGAAAGSSRGDTIYTIQNRAVIGVRDARLISTTSYASEIGLKGDVFAAQLDKPGIRYTAGAFWAPGLDLVGRRKILGFGVESQFDTRSDKDFITGTPLVVSLSQRSRVDLLVDGRLMSSRTYEAGNQSLDTSALPDGAYEVILRIQESGGATRDERRFFTKNPRIAPMGHMLWFARGGALVNERDDAFMAPTRNFYAEAGLARRFGRHLAVDATIVATSDRVIAEAGGYLITRPAQVRIAGLVSSKQDIGFLFQANSSGLGRLNYNLDVRRVYSRDNRALVPIGDGMRTTSNAVAATYQAVQLSSGSFTQILGDISYRLPGAQLGLSGFYRKDARQTVNYAIGPTARWSVLQKRGLGVTLEANYSQSNNGRSAYVGIRLQLLRAGRALGASAGVQSITPKREGQRSGIVGGVQAMVQKDGVLGGDLVLAGNVDHSPDNDVIHGRADLRSRMGMASADVVQQTGGGVGTQYSLGFQTSVIANKSMVVLGGRPQGDSVIAVRVQDAPAKSSFQVLVNETPRGIVHAGQTLPVPVTPYRQYNVRIRPLGGDLVRFDTGEKHVSVYPGNVASVAWTVKPVVAMFGRIIWPDGSPVVNAEIIAKDAIGHSDQQGYFQIETSPNAEATVHAADGRSCRLLLKGVSKSSGYVALGIMRCAVPSTAIRIAAN